MAGRDLLAPSNTPAAPSPAPSETPSGGGRDFLAADAAEPSKANLSPTERYNQLKKGTNWDMFTEPAAAMFGGMAGMVEGGYGALLAIASGHPELATSKIQTAQDEWGQWGAPETQKGMQGLEFLGNVQKSLNSVAALPWHLAGDEQTTQDIVNKGLVTTGADALQEAGHPYLAAGLEAAPIVAGGAMGLKAMPRKAPIPAGVTESTAGVKNTPMRRIARDVMHPIEARRNKANALEHDNFERRMALANRTPDERAAGYTLLEDGSVVEDPRLMALVDEAERQGFRRPQLSGIQMANPAEREAFKQMLAIKRHIQQTADYSTRPADVPGQIVTNVLRRVDARNRSAGEQLDVVANGLRGQRVDFTPAVNTFIEDLDNLGIRIEGGGNLVLRGSDVRGVRPAENLLRNIVERMRLGSRHGGSYTPDAYDMHTLKRFIDHHVEYGNRSPGGIPGNIERIVKKLRRNIDKALDNHSDPYDQINTEYMDTLRASQGLKEISRSMDLNGEFAGSNIGQLLRRIMSNQVSRNRIVDAVQRLDRIDRKYGGENPFDPYRLMMFADELDNVFGDSAPYSFMGQVTEGAKLGMEQAMGGRGTRGIWGSIAEPVIQGASGVNETNAFRAIDNLIEYMPEGR